MSEAKTTQDHDEIRRWVEKRGGYPAAVKATESENDPGLLRIDFDGEDEDLDRIEWEAFWKKFDEKNLEFLYQDKTQDGKTSRFCKFVEAGTQ
jgi:hypothetical protein